MSGEGAAGERFVDVQGLQFADKLVLVAAIAQKIPDVLDGHVRARVSRSSGTFGRPSGKRSPFHSEV